MSIDTEKEYETSGFLFWAQKIETLTGRFVISIYYDRGPLTVKEFSYVYFDTRQEAYSWFEEIYKNVFRHIPPPPPPPSKKKDNNVKHLSPKKKPPGQRPLRLL